MLKAGELIGISNALAVILEYKISPVEGRISYRSCTHAMEPLSLTD